MQQLHAKRFLAYFLSALLATLLIVSPLQNAVLRAIAGLLLVLILPGLALTDALFVGNLGGLKRFLFVIVSSVTTTILLTALLLSTPWGIQQGSWAVGLLGITSAAALLARLRRRNKPLHAADFGSSQGRLRVPLPYAMLMAGALFIVGFALYNARTSPPATFYEGYTLLWMIPVNNSPAAKSDTDAGTRVFEIGIDSKEFAPASYTLQVVANHQVIYSWSPIQLNVNQTWKKRFELPIEKEPVEKIEAFLYVADAPGTIYRQVSLDLKQ